MHSVHVGCTAGRVALTDWWRSGRAGGGRHGANAAVVLALCGVDAKRNGNYLSRWLYFAESKRSSQSVENPTMASVERSVETGVCSGRVSDSACCGGEDCAAGTDELVPTVDGACCEGGGGGGGGINCAFKGGGGGDTERAVEDNGVRCGGGGTDGSGGGCSSGCGDGEVSPHVAAAAAAVVNGAAAGHNSIGARGACGATRELPASLTTGDMFDAIIRLEETFVEEGEAQGLRHGQELGLEEGASMGYTHGLRISSEIGFVRGCCMVWAALAEKQQQQQQQQQQQNGAGAGASAQAELVATLLLLVDQFPTVNSLSDDIVQRLMKIRSQFKRIASRMGDTHLAKSAQVLAGVERSKLADDLSF